MDARPDQSSAVTVTLAALIGIELALVVVR
jgi:hypothetical protein